MAQNIRVPAYSGSEQANYRVLVIKNDKLIIRDFYSSDYPSLLPVSSDSIAQERKAAFKAAREFIDAPDVTSGIACDKRGEIVHGSLSVKDVAMVQTLLLPFSH